jgi:hypothetical protein
MARSTAGLRRSVTGSMVTITHRWSRWSTRIRSPPTRSTRPTQPSSGNSPRGASTSRLGRNRGAVRPVPASRPSPASACVLSSDSGKVSNTPRLCLITRTPVPSSPASSGQATSSSLPDGVRTSVSEASGRSGSANRGRYRAISGCSRMVSHGKPLRSCPSRMNAHRRSPASPCHETSTSASSSPAMDFTGYRHSPATRPTTVMSASTGSKAPLPMKRDAERGGLDPSQRLSALPA